MYAYVCNGTSMCGISSWDQSKRYPRMIRSATRWVIIKQDWVIRSSSMINGCSLCMTSSKQLSKCVKRRGGFFTYIGFSAHTRVPISQLVFLPCLEFIRILLFDFIICHPFPFLRKERVSTGVAFTKGFEITYPWIDFVEISNMLQEQKVSFFLG